MSSVSDIHTGPAEAAIGPQFAEEAARVRGKPRAEVTDARGRKIKIRKLSPLDRLRLFEVLGAVLSENAMYFGYAMSAACVEEMGGHQHGMPTSKLQIESMIDRLDDDGLDAISRGYREHFGAGETGDPEAIKKS